MTPAPAGNEDNAGAPGVDRVAEPASGDGPSREPLARFSLSLIKAMLQAGFYAPDHPEARRAEARLLAEFREAVGDRSELSYLISSRGDDRTVTVDGYESEPLPLDKVMLQGMAELFTPKFLEFFDRRSLLSFSLKAGMDDEEFESFVRLMSEPPRGGLTAAEEQERLTRALAERHVIHVSTVFNEDIVGRDRHLPWWVELAVSRLRRDLRVLPLYERATPEELRRIKLQIIDDVIRPLHTPVLLKEFLVNCDLVAEGVGVIEESQVEREIVSQIAETMLAPTARELVADLERLGGDGDDGGDDASATTGAEAEEVSRRLSILRSIAERLRHSGSALDRDLLEPLVARGLVRPEDLPTDLQDELENQAAADGFLARREDSLEALRTWLSSGREEGAAADVARLVPELLRRREYATLADIVGIVDSRALEDGSAPRASDQAGGAGARRASLRDDLRRALATAEAIGQVVAHVGEQDKEGRQRLVELLAFVGAEAGPSLLEAYAESPSRGVRLSLFEAMRRIGDRALQSFLARLGTIEPDWSGVRHVLAVLGEEGDPDLAVPIAHFMHHDNAPVRETALTAVYRLQGAAAERHLLNGLDDPEAAVRALAVSHLGQLRSRDPRALSFYRAALGADDPETVEAQPVVVEVCRALAELHRSQEGAPEAEALLLAVLQRVEQGGLLGKLRKATFRHGTAARAAACDALAVVGSPAAIGELDALAASDEPQVAELATAAVVSIEQRCGVAAPS